MWLALMKQLTLLATADDMPRVQSMSRLAAPAHRLWPLLGNELFPLPDTEEVLLDSTNHLHRLRGAVQCSPCFLTDVGLD